MNLPFPCARLTIGKFTERATKPLVASDQIDPMPLALRLWQNSQLLR